MATAYDDFTIDIVATLSRMRDEKQQQLDLFSSGTCRMHHNGQDITRQTITRVKAEIAEFNWLIKRVESGRDA